MKGLMVKGAVAASVCVVLACAATASPTKRATVTVSGYSGTTELTNFPVLVRISEAGISGFSYSDCKGDGGSDLSFVGRDGKALAHEVDTWDTDGESTVWVKIPALTNNVGFVMRWGDANPASTTASDTWNSDYVGVWHMGETDGACANSTSHGSKYDATPVGATANSVLYSGSDAPVGGARTTAKGTGGSGYLTVASYDDENVGDTFTISGWLRLDGTSIGWPRPFARRNNWEGAGGGFMVGFGNSPSKLTICGNANTKGGVLYIFSTYFAGSGCANAWAHISIVYEGSTARTYMNGDFGASGTIDPVTDNGSPLYLGANPANASGQYFCGAFDEVRLKKGAASADWAKAEYDTVANKGFLSYGAASARTGMMLILR